MTTLQVKILSSQSADELERQLNRALQEIRPRYIRDIKYSTSDRWSEAMIVYVVEQKEV